MYALIVIKLIRGVFDCVCIVTSTIYLLPAQQATLCHVAAEILRIMASDNHSGYLHLHIQAIFQVVELRFDGETVKTLCLTCFMYSIVG